MNPTPPTLFSSHPAWYSTLPNSSFIALSSILLVSVSPIMSVPLKVFQFVFYFVYPVLTLYVSTYNVRSLFFKFLVLSNLCSPQNRIHGGDFRRSAGFWIEVLPAWVNLLKFDSFMFELKVCGLKTPLWPDVLASSSFSHPIWVQTLLMAAHAESDIVEFCLLIRGKYLISFVPLIAEKHSSICHLETPPLGVAGFPERTQGG